MREALIVFAKPWSSPDAKTRLQRLLSAEDARRLYMGFLVDGARRWARSHRDVRWYFSSRPASCPADPGPRASLHLQRGQGLGARMEAAFEETFDAGYEAAVIVGTDSPTLPEASVDAAFAALREGAGIPVGPSEDGGYYLLGLDRARPNLFRDMTYSHGGVLEATLARIAASGATAVHLPEWYDVDVPADLPRLLVELRSSPGLAPATREVLESLAPHYGGFRHEPIAT